MGGNFDDVPAVCYFDDDWFFHRPAFQLDFLTRREVDLVIVDFGLRPVMKRVKNDLVFGVELVNAAVWTW